MACCPIQEKKYGYDDSRFERDVDEHFHCSICFNVLKDPRMCRNNDHAFCLDCITEHLKVNTQTCPECNDHLSVDTLRRPRLLNNYLLKLKINCDHANRGCPEFVCVESLKIHVESCGFSPVMCSNEDCGIEINKQDKDRHENELCEHRKVKGQECRKMQEVVERLEASVMALDGKLQTMNIEMRMNHVDMKKIVSELQDKVEIEVKKEVGEVKKEVKDVKENLTKAHKDVDEVKVMMSQVLEKLNMLEHLNKLRLPSAAEGMLNTPREDILIASGYRDTTGTEVFSWEKKPARLQLVSPGVCDQINPRANVTYQILPTKELVKNRVIDSSSLSTDLTIKQ